VKSELKKNLNGPESYFIALHKQKE